MKFLFLLPLACSLSAQIQTVNDEFMPGARAKINSNFTWLNTNKESALTFTAPLVRTTNTISISLWGSGSRPVASDALHTTGNCAQWSSEGLGDAGAPCGSGSGGYLVTSVGSADPTANCTAPSSTNLAVYTQTTDHELWVCVATNTWRKALTVNPLDTYFVSGSVSSAPSSPSSGSVACYFDSTLLTQVCLNSSGVAFQMVKSTTLAALQKRSCDIVIGDTSGSALTDAQLGPQKGLCFIPAAATVVEIDVHADAGTPSVIVGVDHAGSVSNLVSSALATAASGARACSKTSAVAGIDGATTCSATLQNTSVAAGDYIKAVSGTAGGTAKLLTVHVVYTVN